MMILKKNALVNLHQCLSVTMSLSASHGGVDEFWVVAQMGRDRDIMLFAGTEEECKEYLLGLARAMANDVVVVTEQDIRGYAQFPGHVMKDTADFPLSG